MNTRQDITQELESMGSTLAGLPRAMPYAVPADYFRTGPAMQLALVKEPEELHATPDWGKAMPYPVPAGYFEGLAGSIVEAVAAERAAGALPGNIPLQGPPQGYFSALPGQVLAAAKKAEQAAPATIPLQRRLFRSVQWAAAAIFVLFIGVGAYITFSGDRPANPDMILASVPGNELNDYVASNYRLDMDRVEDLTDIADLQLDNSDIIKYLNETGWDVVDN